MLMELICPRFCLNDFWKLQSIFRTEDRWIPIAGWRREEISTQPMKVTCGWCHSIWNSKHYIKSCAWWRQPFCVVINFHDRGTAHDKRGCTSGRRRVYDMQKLEVRILLLSHRMWKFMVKNKYLTSGVEEFMTSMYKSWKTFWIQPRWFLVRPTTSDEYSSPTVDWEWNDKKIK